MHQIVKKYEGKNEWVGTVIYWELCKGQDFDPTVEGDITQKLHFRINK